MNQVETIADIVAKIRAAAYCQNADSPESVFRLADRIEAAWKHERNEIEASALEASAFIEAPRHAAQSPDNAARMRETLEQAKRIAESTSGLRLADDDKIRDIAEVCDAALAAPARNCDRFADYGEAIRAFEEASDAEDYEEMADWLFAPAAGGRGSEAAR